MSPGVAAVLTILGGLVLLAIAWGPVIVRAINDIPPKP